MVGHLACSYLIGVAGVGSHNVQCGCNSEFQNEVVHVDILNMVVCVLLFFFLWRA